MIEQLSFIINLIEVYPENIKKDIIFLVQESYFLKKKKKIFYFKFDYISHIVKDIERIKRKKRPKHSTKIIEKSKNIIFQNDDELKDLLKDLNKEFGHYYTIIIINDIIRRESRKTFIQYMITVLLALISLTISYIAIKLK